jgi:hypothetical protein
MSNVVFLPNAMKAVTPDNISMLVAAVRQIIDCADEYLSNPKQLVQRHIFEDALMNLELAIIPFNEGSHAPRQSIED